MLVAACDLRQEIRHFRVSRMSGPQLMPAANYELPAGFNLEAYKPPDDRKLEVILLADHSIADRIKESNYYYIDDLEEHREGLKIRLRVRRIEEILSWVLGFGANITVLEPESMRLRVRDEAEKILKRY
jgi:predicted DNA-binding transcriptional regulator YafY